MTTCKYCGNAVDDMATMCPYCGNSLNDEYDMVDDEDLDTGVLPNPGGKKASFGGFKRSAGASVAPRAGGGAGGGSSFALSIMSVAGAVLSLIAVIMLMGMNGTIKSTNNALIQQVNILTSTVSSLETNLSSLESTVANVQNDAYNQLASQNINITKDLTSLTGPVTLGKYNTMFILKAKGALNIDTSFEWQRYNTVTGGWVPLVFTGTATTNDQYGLRIENGYNSADSEYSTTLWANGITEEAAGSYRCVVTDSTGVKKTSAEVTVSIAAA